MQVQLGMMVCRIPLPGQGGLLFTFYCTSKENLVWPITFVLFNAGSSNLACNYTWNDSVSRTITRSLLPTFYSIQHIKGKYCPAYNFHSI